MSDSTSFLPCYDFSTELNAKYLRKILQLMVQHKIPATPLNYAIWYEYVTENNAQLNAEIDLLLTEQVLFDAETSLGLYKRYICHVSLDSFEKINEQIHSIITQTNSSLKTTQGKADQANVYFQRKSTLLEGTADVDAEVLNATLQSIIQETKSLTQVTVEMQAKLDSATQELLVMRQELIEVRRVAVTDALTGLLNRRAFDDTLSELIRSGQHQRLCLCMLDIDHFKRVNDTYGHIVGDNVIRFVATVMKNHTKEHQYSARYGGEEMALIMPETTNEEALAISEKIRSNIEKSVLKRKDNSEPLGRITVSIGIAELVSGDTVDTLVSRADQALYNAKGSGRNKVSFSAI